MFDNGLLPTQIPIRNLHQTKVNTTGHSRQPRLSWAELEGQLESVQVDLELVRKSPEYSAKLGKPCQYAIPPTLRYIGHADTQGDGALQLVKRLINISDNGSDTVSAGLREELNAALRRIAHGLDRVIRSLLDVPEKEQDTFLKGLLSKAEALDAKIHLLTGWDSEKRRKRILQKATRSLSFGAQRAYGISDERFRELMAERGQLVSE